MKTCRDIMTSNTACCLDSDKVYSVAQRMENENIGSMPVVESHNTNKLIGIITDRDLAIRVVGASRDATNTQVSDVMTHDPLICHPGDDIEKTLAAMANHQVRRIPVVNEAGQVVGIIAQADVALRLQDPDKVGKIVVQISQPERIAII